MHDWFRHETPRPSKVEISKRLGIHESTVRYWLSRDQPPSTTDRSPPPYRPQGGLAKPHRQRLLAIARATTTIRGEKFSPVRNSRSTRDVKIVLYPTIAAIAREFASRTGISLKTWTVRRILLSEGWRVVRKHKAPYLSDEAKKRRVAFARALQNRVPDDIVFSDESIFDTNDYVGYQWVGPRETPIPQHTSQSGVKVIVWGMIGKGFKKLVVFPEDARISSSDYVDLALRPNVRKLRHVTFQADNARAHVSFESRAWLASEGVRILDPEWPASSPDLSPIENVWKIMKPLVSQRAPYGYAELKRVVEEEFAKIPQATIDSLVASFPSRLRKVIAVRGECVS